MTNPPLRIRVLDADLEPPVRAHDDDAGVDLRSTVSCILEPGETVKVGLGVAAEIPAGWVGLVAVRSSVGSSGLRLANQVGVIDAGYRGEISAVLTNHGAGLRRIDRGDRIVQLVCVPCLTGPVEIVTDLAGSGRGDGGYGSTGVR